MPALYMFEDRSKLNTEDDLVGANEKSIVPLAIVDEEICQWVGEEYDKIRYSRYYNEMIDLAFASLLNLGGTTVQSAHVEWMEDRLHNHLSSNKAVERKELAALTGMIRWALLKRWRFSATR